MSVRIGVTIAERVLTHGQTGKRIIVRLGMPQKERPNVRIREAELPVWMCPFQIAGVGRSRVERALGLDAIQALQIAIQAIRVQLERRAKGATWAGGEQGDPGFPQVVPSFGLAFDRRMSRIIAREEKLYVREVVRRRREARDRRPIRKKPREK